MSVYCNEEAFELYGTSDCCGAPLYELTIETGEALCSQCDGVERFDPAPIRALFESPELTEVTV